MRLSLIAATLPWLSLSPAALIGCSADPGPDAPSAGKAGQNSVGGLGSAVGGSSGGSPTTTAGGPSGGVPGGGAPSGGAPTTAGAAGGPAAGTGGVAPTAGSPSAGGSGGAVPGGEWTLSEDPGAACTVGTMPPASGLMAQDKLPDPFKKMDGTTMTSKKEWLCRREEILQQGYTYIYGPKPRTPKDAVSGTVSNTSISVMVSDAGKTGSFTASVSLPTSGTKPYPAVIGFGGVTGMPVGDGIATINFNATAVAPEGNGSNPGSGAFYNVYGPDHEAGLLVAWAWGISRIIDVLEKNPGTIDATKLAVTGCSRYGKGAFVSGVLDNRIALTIPVESGIGGTPALRLIEQLDSYSGAEWPYHAISYQQWFSPEKLGQFTSANSAGADNTNKIPVDMHEMMALIVPRGLYIVDNPSTMYNGLDRNSAYATGLVGQMIFKALGYGDNFTYQGASGSHCSWRSQYTAPLQANLDKFLRGKTGATGTVQTDLGGTKPTAESVINWTAPTLTGDL
jgi:hypothetical protein